MKRSAHAARLHAKLQSGNQLSQADREHARSCAGCREVIANEAALDAQLRAAASALVREQTPAGVASVDTLPPERHLGWVPVFAVVLAAAAIGLGISALRPSTNGPALLDASPSASAPPRSSTPSASPAVLPAGVIKGQVDEAGLIAKGGLWARSGKTLYLSMDGSRWDAATLPGTPAIARNGGGGSGSSVFFLDRTLGWVVTVGPGSTQQTGMGPPMETLHLVVSRTTDGGRTWSSSPLAGNYAGTGPVLAFADELHGYLICASGRFGPRVSTVLRTEDGGRTWSVASSSLMLGSVVTTSDSSTVWAGNQGDAGPVARPILEVSRDGGRTWSDGRLPGHVGEVGVSPRITRGPLFVGADGVLALEDQIFRTTDAGRTWKSAGKLPGLWPVAFIDQSNWVMAGPAISVTDDGGVSWREQPSLGLPRSGSAPLVPAWIGFIDPQHGAVLVPRRSTLPGSIFVTADGGKTWAPAIDQIPPPPPYPRPAIGIAGVPASSEVEGGGFRLTVWADQQAYAAGQAIKVRATLTYIGPRASVTVAAPASGIVTFSVAGYDPPIRMSGGSTSNCSPYTFTRGVPQEVAFSKSGGFSADDPAASFYQAYYADPVLRLPASTWTITARALSCPGDRIDLSATVKLLVVP